MFKRDLRDIPEQLVEIQNFPQKSINETAKFHNVFIQKCPVCGAMNFTSSADEPNTICYNCHRKPIASITPVSFVPKNDDTDDTGEKDDRNTENRENDAKTGIRAPEGSKDPADGDPSV